jgi:DNA ligase-1
MIGKRASTINESFEISGKPALADFKYDGLRVQIHNNKGDVSLFSRNLDNITKQFPEIIDFIKENYSDISFVIDSECVGFDFDKQVFLPFQMLSRRIMTKDINDVKHINVVVRAFDVMLLNNENLIDEPYEKRREKLNELFVGRTLSQNINFDFKELKKVNSTWDY